jgi:hypothetical protein
MQDQIKSRYGVRGGTVEIEREVEGGVVHESSSCLRYSEVLPGVDPGPLGHLGPTYIYTYVENLRKFADNCHFTSLGNVLGRYNSQVR